MRKYGFFLLALTGIVLLNACDLVPTLNVVPRISPRDVRRYQVKDALGNQGDSLVISVNFEDGDGDLGLTQGDTVGPYRQFIDGAPNEFYYNYFLTIRKKVGGRWVQVEFPSASLNYSGRFPLLSPDERGGVKRGPIQGILDYTISLYPPVQIRPLYILPGDTLQFEVQIADRALHKSEAITTQEVVVLTPNP